MTPKQKRISKNIAKGIVLASIYLASCMFNYKWFSQSYSKGGRWENLDPSVFSLAFTFVPIVNTIFAGTVFLIDQVGGSHGTLSKFYQVHK